MEGKKVTWAELWESVRLTRSALKRSGVKTGDRVAALVANSVWAIVLFLASASLGAVFTSISPDLGTEVRLCHLNATTRNVGANPGPGLRF